MFSKLNPGITTACVARLADGRCLTNSPSPAAPVYTSPGTQPFILIEMTRQKRLASQQRSIKLTPTHTLPERFYRKGSFSLAQGDYRKLILLNLIGAALFFGLGWVFLTTALNLRPDLGDGIMIYATQWTPLVILGNLAGMAVMVLIHELVHGLFFWAYTLARPVIGLKLFYAYAAAPGWYLPRGRYLIVALAPLVLLTGFGYAALLVITPIAALPLLFGITMNAAGSVGDIAVVIWLLRHPGPALVEDVGDAVHLYQR
jgi:hypothetical protein